MIYIASLYTNGITNLESIKGVELLDKRFKYTMRVVKDLMLEGKFPYSPIIHCHEMSKEYSLPKGYEFWEAIDCNAIKHCESMIVLEMRDEVGHWVNSIGMQSEIAYANSIGKSIYYKECLDYTGE